VVEFKLLTDVHYFICLGLSQSEARKLDSFFHFSKAKNPEKSILEIGDLNPAIDFLDVLSDDIPKGETPGVRSPPDRNAPPVGYRCNYRKY